MIFSFHLSWNISICFLLLFLSLPKTQAADDKYVSKQLNQLQKSPPRGAQQPDKGGQRWRSLGNCPFQMTDWGALTVYSHQMIPAFLKMTEHIAGPFSWAPFKWEQKAVCKVYQCNCDSRGHRGCDAVLGAGVASKPDHVTASFAPWFWNGWLWEVHQLEELGVFSV